jgi:hypothetical protein
LLAQIQSVQALQSFTTPRGGPIFGRSGEKLAAVADNPILFLFERLNRPSPTGGWVTCRSKMATKRYTSSLDWQRGGSRRIKKYQSDSGRWVPGRPRSKAEIEIAEDGVETFLRADFLPTS